MAEVKKLGFPKDKFPKFFVLIAIVREESRTMSTSNERKSEGLRQ